MRNTGKSDRASGGQRRTSLSVSSAPNIATGGNATCTLLGVDVQSNRRTL
jgi:hypothetical protein